MPRTKRPEYFVATTSGTFKIDGKRETFVKNQTIVHRSSSLYREYPELFRPVEHRDVETATAAPGERR